MGQTVGDLSSNEADFLCISCTQRGCYGKCCDVCGDGYYYFRSVFLASEGAGVAEASIAVDCKSMGHTVGDRSSNEADFLCITCI
jgi:hypothetical protein